MSVHSYPTAEEALGAGRATTSPPPRWIAVVAGVLSIGVGIAALVWPGPTLMAVGILFGAYLLIWGVGLLLTGVSTPDLPGGLRTLDILAAVLALFAGLVLMVRPGESITAIAWVLGFWWTVLGILHLVRAVVQPFGRLWNLVWGVVGTAAGIVILASPQIALGTLVLVVAISLILQGLIEVLLVLMPGEEPA